MYVWRTTYVLYKYVYNWTRASAGSAHKNYSYVEMRARAIRTPDSIPVGFVISTHVKT